MKPCSNVLCPNQNSSTLSGCEIHSLRALDLLCDAYVDISAVVPGAACPQEKMQASAITSAWNAQADEFNQWDELGEDEKVEFAAEFGVARCLSGGEPK